MRRKWADIATHGDAIAQCYREGKTVLRIAYELGLTQCGVRDIVQQMGLKPYTRPKLKPNEREPNETWTARWQRRHRHLIAERASGNMPQEACVSKITHIERVCPVCDSEFKASHASTLYCTAKCSGRKNQHGLERARQLVAEQRQREARKAAKADAQADAQAKRQKRRSEMIAMRESGKTSQDVAAAFGITQGRVSNLVGNTVFEYTCRICDTPFQSTHSARTAHCSRGCYDRGRIHGLKKARELTALHREREANKAAGLRRCYGPCKQWLPRADFSHGNVRMCKKCAIARQQKYYYQRKANNAT